MATASCWDRNGKIWGTWGMQHPNRTWGMQHPNQCMERHYVALYYLLLAHTVHFLHTGMKW